MNKIGRMAAALVAVTFVISLGWRTRIDYLSCDKCRSLKTVTTKALWGVTLLKRENSTSTLGQLDCTHNWWRRARTEYLGPYGILRTSAASNWKQYKTDPNQALEAIGGPRPPQPKR